MGDIYVHGALGMPIRTLDSSSGGAFSKESPSTCKEERLGRSYSNFAANVDDDEIFPVASTEVSLFNPDMHLVYQPPKRIYTMHDLALSADNAVSQFAVSESFPLFSEEAVDTMRAEILSDVVQENYSFNSDFALKQLRGYAPKHAKFVADAWKHQSTLEIISKIVGMELVPVIDYEIGHTNISIPGTIHKNEDDIFITEGDCKVVVDWHRDSYPFVCILMMSDTTGMVGEETVIKTGTGEIMKVRGSTKGCAVVLQGRYIEHQALCAFGSQERITMVTSFRPRSPKIRDDTVLGTVRPIFHLPDLYGQVIEYQLENMEARLREYLQSVHESMKADKFDVRAFKHWAAFERQMLNHIDKEIVEEDQVQNGVLLHAIETERIGIAASAAASM